MIKHIYIRTILLIVLLTAGCSPQKMSNGEALDRLISGVQGKGSDMWRGTYYCGTKAEHHYILHRIDLVPDKLYVIPTNRLMVLVPFYVTSEVSEMVNISDYQNGDIIDAANKKVVKTFENIQNPDAQQRRTPDGGFYLRDN